MPQVLPINVNDVPIHLPQVLIYKRRILKSGQVTRPLSLDMATWACFYQEVCLNVLLEILASTIGLKTRVPTIIHLIGLYIDEISNYIE